MFIFLLFLVAGTMTLNGFLPDDIKFLTVEDLDISILGVTLFTMKILTSSISFLTPFIYIIGIMITYLAVRLVRGGG